MHLSGETEISASRQRVWASVSNPKQVAESNPQGQAQVEKIDDTHYRITVAAAGPMPMNVVLELELTEVEAPSRIAGRVGGSVMGGHIDGTGSIDLAELEPKLTRATWSADARLGGMLGAFDSMIAGPLQQAVEQGVASLKERLEAEEAGQGAAPPES
jgi:carbon monoxide dehydrogenase subunit G